jgi:uncharacterized protein (TIGR02117 family)
MILKIQKLSLSNPPGKVTMLLYGWFEKSKLHVFFIQIILLGHLLLFPATVTANNEQTAGQSDTVFVVQQAWHTGIIFQTKDVNAASWPEIHQYTSKKYVDVSWGDERFYQADGRPVFLAARAVLWPTQSVMRIFPFELSPQASYGSGARIMAIAVNSKQLKALSCFVANSYQRDSTDTPQLSTFQETNRYFYLARRKYHLFRTCNTWVALAFKEAGFDVRSCCILNANQLFRQLEEIGEYLQQ